MRNIDKGDEARGLLVRILSHFDASNPKKTRCFVGGEWRPCHVNAQLSSVLEEAKAFLYKSESKEETEDSVEYNEKTIGSNFPSAGEN